MAKAIDILESKQNLKILPVFVSTDPQRDTPSQLRAYLKGVLMIAEVGGANTVEFDSRIIGLTGPVAAIRQMAQEYCFYFKKVEEDGSDYLVDCSHNMYLLNPKMEVTRCFGVEYNAEELSEVIGKELNRNPS
ncbi:protein SCO1 homolog 2, mitochondrial-like [Glycine soja]|nr:protein SCO1 homolog 2, mitochondrial-like [Glycine soja]